MQRLLRAYSKCVAIAYPRTAFQQEYSAPWPTGLVPEESSPRLLRDASLSSGLYMAINVIRRGKGKKWSLERYLATLNPEAHKLGEKLFALRV
jgi:hypothetical protein